MSEPRKYLCWVDLETTGSDENSLVLEIAVVITDDNLKVLFQSTEMIHHNNTTQSGVRLFMPMFPIVDAITIPDVVNQMHYDSDLWYDYDNPANFKFPSCRAYDLWLSKQITNLIYNQDVWLNNESYTLTLAGSGVSHFDWYFIKRDFPSLWERLNGYTDSGMPTKPTFDIGVLRRICKFINWPKHYGWPNDWSELNSPEPRTAYTLRPHRALYDVLYAIETLKWFEHQLTEPGE